MKTLTLLIPGLLLSPMALAQDPVQQQQQQQFQAEQNRLGYYNNQQGNEIVLPPRPAGEWIKTWGAIAESESGRGGVSTGKLSKKEAEQEAVNQCITEGGGGSCKPVFAYRNQCVVYVSGQQPNGLFAGAMSSTESIERSSQRALQNCAARSLKSCEVIYAACTEPIFRHY
ncbi:MAG: DUF4189 domain-containing protein [Pseudoxanthomonas sp.]